MNTVEAEFSRLLSDPSAWFVRAFASVDFNQPLTYFWWLIVAWGASYFLAVRPSARIYERQTEDHNPLRIFAQFLAAVLIPFLLFESLTNREDEIFFWGALAVFLLARYFTRIVSVNGPDAQSDNELIGWVQVLCEGETKHLIDTYWRQKGLLWKLSALAIILALCGVLAVFAFAAYALGLEAWSATLAAGQEKVGESRIAVLVGVLFSGVAISVVVIAWGITQRALGEQSVSFPVRYGVAANSLQVFLSATWAGLFPWFAYASIDAVTMFQAVSIVAALYLTFVVWPIWRWRVRFRSERQERVSEFRRVLTRLLVATERYDGTKEEDKAHRESYMNYRTTSLKRATKSLKETLRAIVEGSPFRALCMLHVNEISDDDRCKIRGREPTFSSIPTLIRWLRGKESAQPYLLDRDPVLAAYREAAGVPTGGLREPIGFRRTIENFVRKLLRILPLHEQDAEPIPPRADLDPFQTHVVEWIKSERASGRSSRLLDALYIANPQLIRVLKTRRYQIERTDYRYRMMYWVARLLARTRADDTAHLHQLTKEAIADLAALERRSDSRSLVLVVGGAVGTFLVGLAQGLASNPIIVEFFRR